MLNADIEKNGTLDRDALKNYQESEKKSKPLTASTIGNKSIFSQQKQTAESSQAPQKKIRYCDDSITSFPSSNSSSSSSAEESSSTSVPSSNTSSSSSAEDWDDENTRNEIENLAYCCPKGCGDGCILKHFKGVDALSDAAVYVKECRFLGKNSPTSGSFSRDQFVASTISSMIVDDTTRGDTRIFSFEYKLPSTKFLHGEVNKLPGCEKSVKCVFGISDWEWRKCVTALKESSNGRISSFHHKVWKDDYLHKDVTFAEVEDIVEKNLGTTNPSM
jgi:hypothetical protein